MTELFTKKDMRYGGKPSDYHVLYEHCNSGKMFKSLADARKYAIEYCIREHKNGYRTTNMDGNYYDVEQIEARLFYRVRSESGTPMFNQQSGKSRYVGYVYIRNDREFYWRPANKKGSAWLNRDGRVKRKMTPKEIREEVW